ncbi:MAG: hypothetical protein AB7O91_06850 [Sphingomonas sp.]
MQMTLFLRRVLLLDAASCLGMGLGLVAGAAVLAGPLGLPAILLSGAGIALIPIGLFMAFVAARAAPPAILVWLVVLGNVAWVAKSLAVIALFPTISALGIVFVAGQAAFVAAIASLEYSGLRRATAPAVA